jgi:DNA-binding MarR family transcriptional regulator
VARKPAANDRRTKLAGLTAAGRRACEDGTRVQRAAERDLLKRLSADETRQLGSLLAKLGGLEG